MKSIVFDSPGKFRFEDRPRPQIKYPDDVLIKIHGVGICGTDLHILHPDAVHPSIPGTILGHEYTGEVVEIGEAVVEFKPGDTIIADPHPYCGRCVYCRDNRPDRCSELYFPIDHPEFSNQPRTAGLFKDGGLTNYIVAPSNSLYHISSKVPYYHAALAEPLACVLYAVEKLHVKPGDIVSILGAGPIGLLFSALLKINGASKIIVSEPSDYRREKALKCGADIIVDPTHDSIQEVVAMETDNDGVDISIECVGDMFATACSLTRNGGKVLQFGQDEITEVKINVGQLIVRKDLEIHGSFIGKYMFKRVAELIESGKLPLEEITTHVIPLSEFQDALDLLHTGQALKVIITPEPEEGKR